MPKVRCPVCHGWGTVKDKWVTCNICKGKGKGCKTCKGKGKLRESCPRCHGSGYFKPKEPKKKVYGSRR